MKTRKMYTRDFKIKIGKALQDGTSVESIMQRYPIDRQLLLKWGRQYHNGGDKAFKAGRKKSKKTKVVSLPENVVVQAKAVGPEKLNGVLIDKDFVQALNVKWKSIAIDIKEHEMAIERLKKKEDPLFKLVEAANEYVNSL